ncbi:hypothetical protein ABZ260_34815 [Streptosporangium sp. NPDC006013]|uniref:hypothetical protein n=1 Tax=Streptosporangium sp. NPDC006013 TaxID=3155596 RepID=UPI0033B9EC1F
MSKDESSIRIMAGTAAIHDGRPRGRGERCDTFAGVAEDGRERHATAGQVHQAAARCGPGGPSTALRLTT